MNKGIYSVLLLTFLFGCQRGYVVKRNPAQWKPQVSTHGKYTLIPFCQLPAYRNEVVYVRGVYSGMEEYWGFSSAEDRKKCSLSSIELTLSDSLIEIIQDKYALVHANYSFQYLVVDAVGKYEDDQSSGYGHLGHNKAQFIVQELIQVQLISDQKQKSN